LKTKKGKTTMFVTRLESRNPNIFLHLHLSDFF
jgi:hypothetical protein